MKSRYDLEAAFAARLLPVARAWRREVDQALVGIGVSTSTGWALLHVKRAGGAVRQTDLAHMLEITNPSLVRLLDQLASVGMIERRADPDDARVRRIGLTRKGRALAERIETIFAGLRAEATGGISDTDLATALDVVERAAAVLAGRSGAS